MSLIRCPYCEQGNPEESRFCNACGGALHFHRTLHRARAADGESGNSGRLLLVPRQLPGRRAGALVPVSPGPRSFQVLARPRAQVINLRHAVSRVRSGERVAVDLLFHDAR